MNTKTPTERFLEKVNKLGPIPEHAPELGNCWVWNGAKSNRGYGSIKIKRKNIRAHRFSWENHNNTKIPSGYFVCHKCDNPICVNPQHLYAGTQKQNELDKRERGRIPTGEKHGRYTHPERTAKGEAHGMAVLCADDVIKIRQLDSSGVPRKEIAKIFPVGTSCIGMICRFVTWSHIKSC